MEQITIDEFVKVEVPNKMICCSLASGYHWLRITENQTPKRFKDKIDFTMDEQDHLYLGTEDMKEIIRSFYGSIQYVEFDGSVQL